MTFYSFPKSGFCFTVVLKVPLHGPSDLLISNKEASFHFLLHNLTPSPSGNILFFQCLVCCSLAPLLLPDVISQTFSLTSLQHEDLGFVADLCKAPSTPDIPKVGVHSRLNLTPKF